MLYIRLLRRFHRGPLGAGWGQTAITPGQRPLSSNPETDLDNDNEGNDGDCEPWRRRIVAGLRPDPRKVRLASSMPVAVRGVARSARAVGASPLARARGEGADGVHSGSEGCLKTNPKAPQTRGVQTNKKKFNVYVPFGGL